MRWVQIFSLVLVLSIFAVKPVRAVAEFAESYETIYQVGEDGVTTVIHNIELRNKLSNVYADKYYLSLGFTDVSEVEVNDGSGRVVPEIGKTQNQTTIAFRFVNRVVLKDMANVFSIRYKTRDIVMKNGAVWEINIPKLEVENDLEKNNVSLIVPSNFGIPAFMTPEPVEKTSLTAGRNTDNTYRFDMNVTGNKSISAVFGTTQYMTFELGYFLENVNPIKNTQEIAIPMDTGYQMIWLQSIEPKPENVRTDGDGNWLAQYSLAGNQKLRVKATGIARINFLPQVQPEPLAVLEKYVEESELWNSEAPKIKDLAGQLQSAKLIYQYVVDHLTYDYTKLNGENVRLGGGWSIEQKTGGICTDYSDLFISLSRAAGIPAREMQGFAFTSNDKLRPVSINRDVLHSWPEYYDIQKQTWIAVDPTWADTTGGIDYFNKLDLNHFAFVIHGESPYRPQPAGAYKDQLNKTKDVEVAASEAVVFPQAQIEVGVKDGKLKLINRGQVAMAGNLKVTSDLPGIIDYKAYVAAIPPFAYREFELKLNKPRFAGRPVNLKVEFGDKYYEVETDLKRYTILPAGFSSGKVAGVILATVAALAGGLWLRRRK